MDNNHGEISSESTEDKEIYVLVQESPNDNNDDIWFDACEEIEDYSNESSPDMQKRDTRYDESDIQQYKKAINKACGNFIDYMEPDPILDCVIEIDLFGYRETRDIKEEKNTTEKNRRILEKVRSKGNTGYEKFKDCLHKTDQSILVELLECIEREVDTSSLLQQIKEKKKPETTKESLSAQTKTPTLEEDETYLKLNTVAGDTRYDESDIQKTKRAIDKASGTFIGYMEPDPILDCVIEMELFRYTETRDIKEEKNTTEKNRRILEKVRSKGETEYEQFKDCLHKTDQSILVKLLECIERNEDTSSLLQQIKEKKTSKTMKGRHMSPIMTKTV